MKASVLFTIIACIQGMQLSSVSSARLNKFSSLRSLKAECVEVDSAPIVCPPDEDGGLYANPYDCYSFFQCTNGRPCYFECANADLVFNPAKDECDFAENVPGCENATRPPSTTRGTTTTTTTTTSKPTVTYPGGYFECPPDNNGNGFYPVPGTCGQDYFSCVSGVPSILVCPADSIFDPQLLYCVPPGTASCSPTTTSTSRPTVTYPGGYFVCPADNNGNGVYPIPDTCGQEYFNCVNGVPSIVTCPGDNVFDPVLLKCVSAETASCRPVYDCPKPDGFYPIGDACQSLHYVCILNEAYFQTCPGDSIFDPTYLYCVLPNEATCTPTLYQSRKHKGWIP